jgi:NAD-dependent SIR2 family protein deacetylase
MTPDGVVFLLGAGASKEAGVPVMRDVIADLRQNGALSPSERAELDQLEPRLFRAAPDGVVDVELLLAALDRVRHLEHDLTAALLDRPADQEFNRPELANLEERAKDWLRRRCSETVNPTTVRYLRPLLNFARTTGTLDVFSLNYDCCIETLADDQRVELVDGLEYSWAPDSLGKSGDPTAPLIRLHKLHGSLIWYRRPDYGWVKIPLIPPPRETLTFYNGDPVEELMVYPAVEKVGDATPLMYLAELFRNRLRDAAVLVIIGYSLRDENVARVIDERMTRDQRLTVVIVDPNAVELRSRYFSARDFLSRTLAVPVAAGAALAQNGLQATVNGTLNVRRQLASASAFEALSVPQARKTYRVAVAQQMALGMIDGARVVVERIEEMYPDQPSPPDTHPMPALDACLAFALVDGANKSVWWRLLAALLFWWESQIAQNAQLQGPNGPYAARPGVASLTPSVSEHFTDEDVAAARVLLDAYVRLKPNDVDGMAWRYLQQLVSQVEVLSRIQALCYGPGDANTNPSLQELAATLSSDHSPSELAALLADLWDGLTMPRVLRITWHPGQFGGLPHPSLQCVE